ncbi:hypothetical protein L596_009676 [Steinernema carpocapsae]|uniref:Uncharacterized protein n=1 Tax=Steinernema carpocapsae TaxID=34508 RepID=A0A4U5PGJ6_STECR|nr:hypothetical protein L596_009676 [Steinernema carpocapsae]
MFRLTRQLLKSVEKSTLSGHPLWTRVKRFELYVQERTSAVATVNGLTLEQCCKYDRGSSRLKFIYVGRSKPKTDDAEEQPKRSHEQLDAILPQLKTFMQKISSQTVFKKIIVDGCFEDNATDEFLYKTRFLWQFYTTHLDLELCKPTSVMSIVEWHIQKNEFLMKIRCRATVKDVVGIVEIWKAHPNSRNLVISSLETNNFPSGDEIDDLTAFAQQGFEVQESREKQNNEFSKKWDCVLKHPRSSATFVVNVLVEWDEWDDNQPQGKRLWKIWKNYGKEREREVRFRMIRYKKHKEFRRLWNIEEEES